ncbi:MAG: non-homologous end-joining DNA ligase [Acidimicrobiia bacterium]|nr:non-homologous end-joining DNA ligase [Acidimicrobiia bacterium]
MLATPWAGPFVDDEWLFELKWDGVRGLLTVDDRGARLYSRAGNDMTGRYPELVRGSLPADVVVDGEIVALDDNGLPSFERLQGRMNLAKAGQRRIPVPVSFVAFDLLHAKTALIDRPLEERLERLNQLEFPGGFVIPDRFAGDPHPIWDFVAERGLEGIVAKRLGSRYQPGVRSGDWRKISRVLRTRAIVGGFTAGTGGRADTFGSLLLGLWTDDGLRWIGAVGTGFDDAALLAIRAALDEMIIADAPFIPDPELPTSARWVDPSLVAVVEIKQWTRAGRMRAPVFKGFSDHSTRSVTWDSEGPAHAP